jgi:cyclopropane fatty-acyl-phospholipid synthase-like methyltransferase
MYLKRRLKVLKERHHFNSFIELGSGDGAISNILLNAGMTGAGFDLNEEACAVNKNINNKFLEHKRYEVINKNFFESSRREVDLIISSHVIEHLPSEELSEFFTKSFAMLKRGGRIISLVPSGMEFWGVEDDSAGHFRMFEYNDFKQLASKSGLKVSHMRGLTYPVSNILLSLSNYLIKNE